MRITIYDTTLREGEQCPGVNYTVEDKLKIASLLTDLGVKQIEAGFPSASKLDFEAVKRISDEKLGVKILALSRINKKDIDRVADAGADVALLFAGTSEIHLKYKMRMSREHLIERIVDSLCYARERGIDATFTAEDATRTDWDFLKKLMSVSASEGAWRIGIADTVGCMVPEKMRKMVAYIHPRNCDFSVHLHNDFGLALANALAAIKGGANAVSVTVGGIGERCGNVPLEQIVCTLEFLYNIDTGINLKKLYPTIREILKISKISLSPHAPIVGENSFTHKAGIHLSAVLINPEVYEYLRPSLIGREREMILTKKVGKNFVAYLLMRLNIRCNDDDVLKITERVKEKCATKERMSIEEFKMLADEVLKK